MVLLCAISPQSFAQISVSISPTTPTVATLATQQFTATVTGTTNTAVTWEVNGLAGGNSADGVISTAGLYLGPSSVPNPATVTVTAVSQADNTTSASVTVMLHAPSRSGVTYYVSTTGKDTNGGSLSAPWRTHVLPCRGRCEKRSLKPILRRVQA